MKITKFMYLCNTSKFVVSLNDDNIVGQSSATNTITTTTNININNNNDFLQLFILFFSTVNSQPRICPSMSHNYYLSFHCRLL